MTHHLQTTAKVMHIHGKTVIAAASELKVGRLLLPDLDPAAACR